MKTENIKKCDVSISPVREGLLLSTVKGDQYIDKLYSGYTRREAVRLFVAFANRDRKTLYPSLYGWS